MSDYLIVRVNGEELAVPFGYLRPNAPLEVDIRKGCPSTHEGIYVLTLPLENFIPAYQEFRDMEGRELDLGDLPHVSIAKPKNKIATPSDCLIDMFLFFGETCLDTVRLTTSEGLPREYSREDFQIRLLLDSRLTPQQITGIKARVFAEEYSYGWSKVMLRGLEIGDFRVGTCPEFGDPHYLEYRGPNGERGYSMVVPALRKFIQELAMAKRL